MQKFLIQCDICTNAFPFHPTEEIIPPPAWYILFHDGRLQFAEANHFCSRGCLEEFVAGGRQIAASQKARRV